MRNAPAFICRSEESPMVSQSAEGRDSRYTAFSLPGKKTKKKNPPLMIVRLDKADLQEHSD